MNLSWTPPSSFENYQRQKPFSPRNDYNMSVSPIDIKGERKYSLDSSSLPQSIPEYSSSARDKRLECEKCGKRYKSPNCLAKHRWEHTDAWKETSKLAMSKHQQVQLLEAATILVGFGEDPDTGVFQVDF